MNRLQFGVFLQPQYADLKRLRENIHVAEDCGLEMVAIMDHPESPDVLDALTVISVLIGETSHIRFVSDVINIALRPPVMLAKAAAGLDMLSGGRFVLGLGAGGNRQATTALTNQHLEPGQVFDAFKEALAIIQSTWTARSSLRFQGKYYTLGDLPSGPVPVHHPGIWFGSRGPRMLSLTGERADGWISPLAMPFEEKPRAQVRIDQAARRVGRDPMNIRRVLQLVGRVRDISFSIQQLRRGPGNQAIDATVNEWAQIISEWAQREHFDTFFFYPTQQTPEQIRRFATEVIPAVGERW